MPRRKKLVFPPLQFSNSPLGSVEGLEELVSFNRRNEESRLNIETAYAEIKQLQAEKHELEKRLENVEKSKVNDDRLEKSFETLKMVSISLRQKLDQAEGEKNELVKKILLNQKNEQIKNPSQELRRKLNEKETEIEEMREYYEKLLSEARSENEMLIAILKKEDMDKERVKEYLKYYQSNQDDNDNENDVICKSEPMWM